MIGVWNTLPEKVLEAGRLATFNKVSKATDQELVNGICTDAHLMVSKDMVGGMACFCDYQPMTMLTSQGRPALIAHIRDCYLRSSLKNQQFLDNIRLINLIQHFPEGFLTGPLLFFSEALTETHKCYER